MNLDDDSDNEEIIYKNDIMNYKGYFVENAEEDEEPKYFEFGAHFSYKELCKALEELRKKQIIKELEKEKDNELEIMKMKQKNNKKIENRERNNTKNKDIKNINLENIIKSLNPKNKSRNIGVPEQNENNNPNELSFAPINHNIKNLSIKNEDKNHIKSISINKANYIKLYSNKKNKNVLKRSNDIINKKFNFKNSNENINKINNNNIINKKFNKNKSIFNSQVSDKFLPSRNREQNYIYQQVYTPYNNQTVNQNNNKNNQKEINYFQSYQMQVNKPIINKNIYKKMFFLNNSSFYYNSKKINKNNFKKRISHMIEPKFTYNSLFKHNLPRHKKIKLDKIINNSASYLKGRIASSNIENLLNSYNSKKIKFSSEKKIEREASGTMGNYYSPFKNNSNNLNNKHYISLKKYKLNDYSNDINYRKFTPVSMNNNKNLTNTGTINKINKDSKKYDKQNIKKYSLFNVNNNLTFQKILNNNHNKTYLNTNQKNINLKINANKKEAQLNYKRINNTNNNINNLFNILDKNEKNSRNKNNDYFINNLSNNTSNKIINSINSNTNIKKMNMTQQNKDYTQFKNPKHYLRNKIFNFNNNQINNNNNKNNNKILIDIPSVSNKKIFITSNEEEDSIFKNNNYKSKFINKKLLSNKTNINFNNVDKIKKRINLTKDIIKKPKIKVNDISKNNQIEKSLPNQEISIYKSKNINQLNNIPNNSYIFKKYENIIKKKSQKKNININININNNNKIIYNKIVNNKSPLLKGNKYPTKSLLFQKVGSYINNTNYGQPHNIYGLNNKSKKSPDKINFNNVKKNIGKVKLNEKQFNKAKLLNIHNKNNNN
jgi:hypothetical protein